MARGHLPLLYVRDLRSIIPRTKRMTFLPSEFVYPVSASLCAVVGSVFDVKSRRVPNFVTGTGFVVGLSLHLALGGWRQLLLSFAGGLVCGIVFLVFYLAGGMGAGDVKLITAVGALAGFSQIGYLLILTALAGGVMAIALALVRGRLRETVMNVAVLATHHSEQGLRPHPDLNVTNVQTLRLPYALAIAAGSLLTLYFQVI
jgi:prepilin peptidase CpaA